MPKFSQLVVGGNSKSGYYAETYFEWDKIDAFMQDVIPLAKQSENFSFAISAFRIGTEFWKYHVDNMNSLSGNTNFDQIEEDLKLAQKQSYSIRSIQQEGSRRKIKQFWSYLLTSFVIGAFCIGYGDNSDNALLFIGGLLLISVPVLLILWGLGMWFVKLVWRLLFGSDWSYKSDSVLLDQCGQ